MNNEVMGPNCQRPLIYDENLDCYICMDCNTNFSKSEFEEEEENEFTGRYNELVCRICGKRAIVNVNFKYDVCPFCYNNLIDIKKGIKIRILL